MSQWWGDIAITSQGGLRFGFGEPPLFYVTQVQQEHDDRLIITDLACLAAPERH